MSNNILKSIRMNLRMTQQEFAESFDVGIASLRNYETGSRDVPPPLAMKISERTNLSLDYIYGNTTKNNFDMELMFRIITTVREIEEEEAEHIDGFRFSNEVFNRLVELVHKRVTKDIKHGETVTHKDIKNNVVELKEFLKAA